MPARRPHHTRAGRRRAASCATSARDAALVDRAAGRRRLRAGPARRAAARALGHRPAVGAAGRRPRRARPQGHRRAAAHRRARPPRCTSRSRWPPTCSPSAPTPDGDSVWLPTDAFDMWSAAAGRRPLGPARAGLARVARGWSGWSAAARTASRSTRWCPTWSAAWLPETRRAALAELAALEPGTVLAAGTGVPSLVERLAWLRPRRPAARAEAVAWAVEEAAVVGVTGARRAVRARPRAARRGRPAAPRAGRAGAAAARAGRPRAAPGRPDRGRARPARAGPRPPPGARVADIESRGGATVYRFTEALGAAGLRLGLVGRRGARLRGVGRRGRRCRRR